MNKFVAGLYLHSTGQASHRGSFYFMQVHSKIYCTLFNTLVQPLLLCLRLHWHCTEEPYKHTTICATSWRDRNKTHLGISVSDIDQNCC